MPVASIELYANRELVDQPLVWRIGKQFHVTTNIQRARVTEDYGHVALTLEGSLYEVEQAQTQLRGLGILKGVTGAANTTPAAQTNAPENDIPQPNTIYVRLSTVSPQQGHAAVLYRVGKDFNCVVNIERAAFDDEEGGSVEITISGPLIEVQRAIAYLHTTGLHVNPRQRSVTDFGNL